ncbi:MAG: hypothetical protein ACI9N1_000686 [Flavobacteriales bacterium]|jgi:hypothetical protein
MKKTITMGAALGIISISAQTNPAITDWLFNTDGTTARHYVSGNSTPINDADLVNVQSVEYSNDYSYIMSTGLPSYIIGPYLDGNPSQASDNQHIFKIPLAPVENTGTLTSTPFGSIGVFVNGVPMYDYKDGSSYSLSGGADAGGPSGGTGDGVWNRDAIKAENDGFDCAKGHPSPIFSGGGGPGGTLTGGTYHHHQNPSAFNLDLVELSDVCDMYLADGLYVVDAAVHSPLLGYAFDGFPIYGAYSYANTDGTGAIKRIESSYTVRNISVRTHYADGSDVTDGPAVSTTYPLGQYREDYEYIAGSGDLDEHNGRFCITPEYPNGIYCYFSTVDANWNSAYPYVVGPEYYGTVAGGKVSSITEATTVYTAVVSINELEQIDFSVFPNPASDFIAVQFKGLLEVNLTVELYDIAGKLMQTSTILKGSTISYVDTRTLYNGNYVIRVTDGNNEISKKIVVSK